MALPAFAATAASAGTAPPALSAEALLARLSDPVAAMAPLPAGFSVVEHSSHDRAGANGDGTASVAGVGFVPQSTIRQEPGGAVLFDEHRPGCVVRIWMTGIAARRGTGEGDVTGFGRLQFFFDDEPRPRLDVAATDLFAGHEHDFPAPLAGDYRRSSGGDYLYTPICFAHALKVRATLDGVALSYYQIEAIVAPHGTPVSEYQRGAVRTGAAQDLLDRAGQPGRRAPTLSVDGQVGNGRTLAATRGGAGTVRFLRVRVDPFDTERLRAVRVDATVDGAGAPQLSVPLGDLFGDGLDTRPIRAVAFGMDPARHTGYFALPIPYSEGVRIQLSSSVAARVHVDAWTGPPAATRERLYGERRVEEPQLGTDITVLETAGSGHLAAWVLDLTGQPGSSQLQSYMEGDDRAYVDGSRSPTVYGTGTEDAFNGGFYYANGAFSLPTHGAGPLGAATPDHSTQSQYRVFGGDALRWNTNIRYTIEHGGSDETLGETAASTTFSYRAPPTLGGFRDVPQAGGGPVRTLTAYFEGERDGDLTVPALPLAVASPAPPATLSPEGFTATGVDFSSPITVALPSAPCGAVLRRLLDVRAPSHLGVTVDGRDGGAWDIEETNAAKRWREADYELPAGAARVTLTPSTRAPENVFGLRVATRTC